tara:strand:- start:11955 stop:12308 length:354 start_codon:yes stop_codon:yes gene_type:complete
MEKELIENEIQRRVDFKMQEIESQLRNCLKAAKLADKHSWGHVYTRGFLKAFQIINDVLDKEINMGTPYDGDFNKRLWLRKEETVDKLSDRLLNRGEYDYMHKKSFINNQIEDFIDG